LDTGPDASEGLSLLVDGDVDADPLQCCRRRKSAHAGADDRY
jgi:hypothetical protein